MKKHLALFLALVVLFSVCGAVLAESEGTTPEPELEKPVHVSVVDDAGAPVSGAALRLLDSEGNVLKEWNSDGELVLFLKEGEYAVENLSVSDEYLAEADPIEIDIALTEEEAITDYVGTVVYDHDHSEICGKASHVGLELYTVGQGPDDQVIAYCFNHGFSNPTEESRYKMLIATPEQLFAFARNKDDAITEEELYNHVLDAIYRSASIQQKFNLPDDTIARFLTYMAIKNFTDPKCFTGYGTVLATMIAHAQRDNKNTPDYVFPQNYIDAFNYLIGDCTLDACDYHPDDYHLYLYYPSNYDRDNDDSYQILMSAKQAEPQKVNLSVRAATQFAITQVWSDAGNKNHRRPTPASLASRLQLFADGMDVTAQYRDNLEIVDNGDDTYSIRFVKLPKLNENAEEIAYTLKIKTVVGYKADAAVAANGETVTFTLLTLSKADLLPIKPRPFEPIIGPVKPVRP